ncbi:MAG: InlB B-repeat-containing protein, partial [Dysgonamonadaceae bacterium]|nr:InlB B-repeat-containing protein [Dysgonamonadaceae bacterium]
MTFQPNGGTTPTPFTSKSVKYGAIIGTMPTTTAEGYKFKGWYDKPDNSGSVAAQLYDAGMTYNKSDNLTLYAWWDAVDDPEIVFNPDGGSVIPASLEIPYNSTLPNLPTPTKSGYKFLGWYEYQNGVGNQYESGQTSTFEHDTEIYAHWVYNQYKITLDPQDGTVDPTYIYVELNVEVGTIPTPTPEPGRIGSIFKGWYPGKQCGGDKLDPTYKYTDEPSIPPYLYACWEYAARDVIFHAQGGEADPPYKHITPDTEIGALPVPVKEGFLFEGWYTSNNIPVTANTIYDPAWEKLDLYAKWTYSAKTITFYPQGGTVSPQVIYATVGTPIGQLPVPVRPGFLFEGWYPNTNYTIGEEVEGTDDFQLTPYSMEKLYAKWTYNGKTIIFNPNGGDVSPTSIQVEQGIQIGAMPVPIRTGYVFKGWYTVTSSQSPTAGTDICTSISSNRLTPADNYPYNDDVTLYACWYDDPNEPNDDPGGGGGGGTYVDPTIEILLDPTGGTLYTPTFFVEDGKAIGTLPTPTRPGYTFNGWYTQPPTNDNGNCGSGTQFISNGTMRYNASDNITTLYACWTNRNITLSDLSISDYTQPTCGNPNGGKLKFTATSAAGHKLGYILYKRGIQVATNITGAEFTGLSAGSYKIVVYDTNDQTIPSQEMEVTLEMADVTPIPAVQKTSETQPTCASPTGGTLQFTPISNPSSISINYELWLDGKRLNTASGTGAVNFSTLSAGLYKLVAINSTCTEDFQELFVNLELKDATPIVGLRGTITNPTCANPNGGAINAIVTEKPAGSLKYELWKGGTLKNGPVESNTITSIALGSSYPAGTYKIVAYETACPSNKSEVDVILEMAGVTKIPAVEKTDETQPKCYDPPTGVLKFKPITNSVEIDYELWLNGDRVQTNTTIAANTEVTFSTLKAGLYKLVAINSTCAEDFQELFVNLENEKVNPIVIQKTAETQPLCNGNSANNTLGALVFSASGGSGKNTFTYTLWKNGSKIGETNNGNFSSTATPKFHLEAGKYKVVVTDVEGCDATAELEVELAVKDATPLTITATSVTKPTCNNTSGNGSITFNIGGGNGTTKSYSYTLLHNGAVKTAPKDVTPNPFTESNLLAGTYKIIVTDKNCTSNIKEHEVV